MRLSEVKEMMKQDGKLDARGLLCYSTLTGTIQEQNFQNLVAVVFSETDLNLYRANMDGSVGEILVSIPYTAIQAFQLKHRFWYSFTEFTAPAGNFRFYNYDRKVFIQGFRDAGLLEG